MARVNPPGYLPGFKSVTGFDSEPRPLALEGKLPDWLRGTLVRNGPGLFEVGPDKLRHWFDGLAVLHQFQLSDQGVSYRSQPLRSPDYEEARKRGRLYYSNFATDPCVARFRRLFSAFYPGLEIGANANVNVARIGERFLAMTETPLPVEFEPHTLRTVGVFGYEDEFARDITTAHPHRDRQRGALLNVSLKFGRKSLYRLNELLPGATRRQILGELAVDMPSYLHSFGQSENYSILTLGSLVVDPKKLLLRTRPFIENYVYERERPTRWALFDRRHSRWHQLESPAQFMFHHVNAFEEGNDLVVDLISYADARVVEAAYLDALERGAEVPGGRLTRYRLGSAVRAEVLSELTLELPRINPHHQGRPYRYAYGISQQPGTTRDFYNMLARLDTRGGPPLAWSAPSAYPGEPVFVPRPQATEEDDGVVLSVVLEGASSFLLVLDAANFRELARARVERAVPFGFHGQFYA